MNQESKIYFLAWSVPLTVSVIHLIIRRSDCSLFSRAYLDFLTNKWKLLTFLISSSAITLIAPHTADPTWDYTDAGFMSILTFLTAPWTVGSIYRRISGLDKKSFFLAPICIWLFSASWSYDIYLYLRDGYYPPTWWSNLILSSLLYFSAGLFWSLDWKSDKGVFLAFRELSWPIASTAHFSKLIWFAIPFAVIAVTLTFGFLKW